MLSGADQLADGANQISDGAEMCIRDRSSWWGMEHILKNIKTKYVLPMHFTDNPKMMLKYLNHEPLKQYNNILKINNEGEIFIIGDNNDD